MKTKIVAVSRPGVHGPLKRMEKSTEARDTQRYGPVSRYGFRASEGVS